MSQDPPASVRLEPADEYMHANSGEQNFNESMYFNFFDPAERTGGFVRIGNRVNEGYAEVTVCIYRPDGEVLFGFQRPKIADNDRFAAGGMHFEVVEPFARLDVAFSGSACRLANPMEMTEPRAAFRQNPFADVQIALAVHGVGPMYGGEPQGGRSSDSESSFARGHYEQHHRATGTLTIAGERTAVDGLGLRDHSWGPRSWQAPLHYRWLTANFGDDFGFMANVTALRDGRIIRTGFVHRGERLISVRGVEIETDWAGEERVHDRIRARLTCDDGEELAVEGRVLSLIPLRNRRDGRVTRISEGMTQWTCDGRTGYGLSEYLDQQD